MSKFKFLMVNIFNNADLTDCDCFGICESDKSTIQYINVSNINRIECIGHKSCYALGKEEELDGEGSQTVLKENRGKYGYISDFKYYYIIYMCNGDHLLMSREGAYGWDGSALVDMTGIYAKDFDNDHEWD